MVFIFIGTTLFGHFHETGITLKCLSLERKLELCVLGKDLSSVFHRGIIRYNSSFNSMFCLGTKEFLAVAPN